MGVAFASSIAMHNVHMAGNDMVVSAKHFLITTAISTVAWVVVTFATRPESQETLLAACSLTARCSASAS
jgi:hypothetical protein